MKTLVSIFHAALSKILVQDSYNYISDTKQFFPS